MNAKSQSAAAILVVLLASVAVMAQTSDELEQRYGRRDNHFVRRIGYEVRPGIIMTVSLAKDSQVCEAIIEPQRVTDTGIIPDKRMPVEALKEILNELVPVAQRGRRTGAMIMGNYTSWAREEYEQVTIMKLLVGVGGPEKDLKIEEVRVRWKQRQCQ